MSCQTCKKVIDPTLTEIELDYSTNVRISPQALVKRPHRPQRGWSVFLPIKGQQQVIEGSSPYEVFSNARKLIKLNGHRVDENNLWFNLNVQWLQKTLPKYRTVTLEELLDSAVGNDLKNEDPHAIQKNTTWIPTIVESIKIYLEAENYKWEEFVGILKRFQRYLDPAENPLLSDANVYISFTRQLETLKRGPIYEREQAKNWFNTLKF